MSKCTIPQSLNELQIPLDKMGIRRNGILTFWKLLKPRAQMGIRRNGIPELQIRSKWHSLQIQKNETK